MSSGVGNGVAHVGSLPAPAALVLERAWPTVGTRDRNKDRPSGLGLVLVSGPRPDGDRDRFLHLMGELAVGGHVVILNCRPPTALALLRETLSTGSFEALYSVGQATALRKRSALPLRPMAPPVRVTTRPAGRAPVRRPAPAELPLVSCIMPTYNRRAYVPRAIRYWQAQDYPHAELIIIDDGTDPVEDLVPADPRARYIRPAERKTIGAKRNLACEQARGDLLINWDDDDWSAPWRVSYQVDMFLKQDVDISGLSVVPDRYECRGGR